MLSYYPNFPHLQLRRNCTAVNLLLSCSFMLLLAGCSESNRNNTDTKKQSMKPASARQQLREEDWSSMTLSPKWVEGLNFSDQKLARINMWVESVDATPAKTVIHVAINGWDENSNSGLLPATGAYIVDSDGKSYNLESENRLGVEPFTSDGQVRPHTIERFELSFPPLTPTRSILLKHPQFPPLTIYKSPASVNFCSPKATLASGTTTIFCNGNFVTELPNGERREFRFTPGQNACGQSGSEPVLRLNLETGKRYYIQVNDTWLSKFSLKLISNEEIQIDNPDAIASCMAER